MGMRARIIEVHVLFPLFFFTLHLFSSGAPMEIQTLDVEIMRGLRSQIQGLLVHVGPNCLFSYENIFS